MDSPKNVQRPKSEKGRQFLDSVKTACLPKINSVTVPILGIQNDRIVHDRSGVLYRVGGHHFVLTAAHGLREIVQEAIPLYLSGNKKGADLVPLADARFISTEDDDRDIAAIWLSPQASQEIGKHKDFLFHNQINLNTDHGRPLYLFFGYPMQWSGHLVTECEIISVGLAFATFEHQGQLSSGIVYHPEVHMLFNFSRKAVNLLTSNEDMLPKPHGISGCGIWQVGDRSVGGMRTRSSDNVALIAIQHSWSPANDYIQATRIGFLLNIIAEHYRDAGEAMKLVYPAGY